MGEGKGLLKSRGLPFWCLCGTRASGEMGRAGVLHVRLCLPAAELAGSPGKG